jgi:hypothetical protein
MAMFNRSVPDRAKSPKRIVIQQWKNAKGAPTPPLAKPSGMPPSSTPPGKY